MKKTNNKGFSLVELIVVVAIMAVLMVVVGPQLLRYVERSRIQRDNTAIAEIANAAKIAMADETINSAFVSGTDGIFTASSGTITFSASGDALEKELNAVIGATVTLQASKYKSASPTVTVTKDGNGIVKVVGTGIYGQDGNLLNSTDSDTTNDGVLVY